MVDIVRPEREGSLTRFCDMCAASGVVTPAERYKGTQLKYCTLHYWLVRGRIGSGGYSLEDYVEWSKLTFTISLPSKADCERLQRVYDEGQREPDPMIELKA